MKFPKGFGAVRQSLLSLGFPKFFFHRPAAYDILRPRNYLGLGGSMANRSSHPVLSYADGAAAGMADTLLLVGRVLLAVLFLMTVWGGGPSADYLKSLGYPAPGAMSVLAHVLEWIIVISLVLGIGTRYGALLGLVFVVIAFGTAHRYWEFAEAAQNLQYTLLSKDLAIAGGLLLLFVTGPGSFSGDEKLRA
jgi:putative oxidoreductase